MYETPGARQPRRDSVPPWDPWERSPAGPDPQVGRYPPPGPDPQVGRYPPPGPDPQVGRYPPPGPDPQVGRYPPPGPDPQPGRYPPAGQDPPAGLQPPAQHRLVQARARERSRWHWLLLAGVLIPLAVPLYNRAQPQLLGLPFFYWCQLAFTGMAALVTGFIQLVTRKRRP